ncbi:MAG: hypothetical protein ACK5P7_01865 [Bdellovibrio sp.]
MFSKLASSLVLLPVLAMPACAFKKESTKDDPKPVIVLENQSGDVVSDNEVVISFVPGKPFEYQAVVSWPSNKRIYARILYPKNPHNPKSDGEQGTNVGADQSSYAILCPSGSGFDIQFSYTNGTKSPPVTYHKSISCPNDFEISGTVSSAARLPKELTGRLFFKRGAVLKINSENLNLNLIGIHVDQNASIEATSYSPSANSDAQIKIAAQSASGTLLLNVSGAVGTNGRSGEELQKENSYVEKLKASAPASGARGNNGNSDQHCRRAPGRGVEGSENCRTVCTREPGAGGKGANGTVAGLDGKDGAPGAFTPSIQVEIKDPKDFRLNIDLAPGAGGIAGAAGKGQPGGPGGSPGVKPEFVCTPAAYGPQGDPAPDGKPGTNGAPGGCSPIKLSESLKGLTDIKADAALPGCAEIIRGL